MKAKKRMGAAITLSIAIGAASALVLGISHVNPAIGAAVTGTIIGTGLALAIFLSAPDAGKRNCVK